MNEFCQFFDIFDHRKTAALRVDVADRFSIDQHRPIDELAVSVDDQKVSDPLFALTREQIGSDGVLLKKGKKGFCRITVK